MFKKDATLKVPVYFIEKTDTHYTLYSLVDTIFGGTAKNFVCEGTHEYCNKIKKRLEN